MKKQHICSTYTLTLKWLSVLSLVLMVSVEMYAQDKKTIEGTVVDSNQEPLIGATIIESGTQNGTTTDFDGHFSITVENGSQLDISYVGFVTQSLVISNATSLPLSVMLESDTYALDAVELVAVGYGSMRKSDLTGAISSVTSDDFLQGNVSSTEQVLQGKVSGLVISKDTGDPSVGASMRLRGGTSLTASNNPLVVVDGVAGVDINTVQPSDIKTMDVLKDASATAIYGSRGANGVIMITTKSIKKGKSVTYTGLTGVSNAASHLDILSANQWRGYVRDNNVQDAIDYGANTNWQKELEQTALSQSHVLSFNSGGDGSGLRASISYLDKEGIIKESGLERLSANLSGHQYAFHNRLKFDAGLFANIDKWHPVDYSIFERAFNLNPTIPVRDANGDFTEVGGTLNENPVEILTNRIADSKKDRLLGYFKTEFDFFNDFKATVNMSLENNSTKNSFYRPSYAVIQGRPERGYGQKTLGEYTTMQLETYLNYNKNVGNHYIGAMAGYSYLDNTYDGFGAQRAGFDTDLFGYNNLGAGQNYRLGDVYSYKGNSKLISFFGRVNYSYDSRYMITATVRRDGSSRFGDNHKWGVFPSASIAWNITNEDFANNSSWLTTLKLRAGYGVTGNQDGIGEYKSLAILGVGSDSYYDPATDSWKLAYSPTQNPNPDLKWESTAQANIGIDFGFFNRVSGSLEFYNKLTSDLLYTYQVPQPPYLVGTMLANVGELSNKGFELSLNADIIQGSDFTWNANVALSSNKQIIEKLSNQVYETDVIYSGSLHGLSGMSGQFSQVIKEGYPVGTFWGKKSSGLDDNGEFILADEDSVLGDVQPDFTIGVGMNFTYKNFDLALSGYGNFGQKVLNATNMMLNDPNRLPTYNVTDDFLSSGITSPATYSGYWIEDASFFRLQTLSVGYNIPTNVNSSCGMRVYFLGENLAVFTDYSGVDPEVGLTGLDNPGIDRFNSYPRPRTFSFGLNITLKD
ncbi:SusC/RagA family TonB-linked outer membrane protein [Formosa haliotis]|uniref:SusC/RagA family TonB-linked outer membrane protein n=1 Tax=Formosa haliotis TaxID=1555194 RepID=UPI001146CE2A|nr:SusC/RagA family TonB-linked outer membrane protein [Formosa haliotis]